MTYNVAACFLIATFSASLQSGSAGVYLFLRNDVITDATHLVFNLGFLAAYLILVIISLYAFKIPRYDFFNRLIMMNIFIYGILGLVLSVSRIQLVSRPVFLTEFVLTTILITVFHLLRHKLYPRHLVALPGVDAAPFLIYPSIRVTPLRTGVDDFPKADGAIVDARKTLDDASSRLISKLVQKRIPVYNSHELLETLWGRISVDQLFVVDVESIVPPRFYPHIKRLLELLVVLSVSPALILISLIVIIFIKLDSPGPILFAQERAGLKTNGFMMLKFRSMTSELNSSHSTSTSLKTRKVTRVGRIIRRFRIDELPQMWHVLTGEMSLIGPRPEQIELAQKFEELIPYYTLRHSVRPGISGWAQVMHGYTDTIEQTRLKLQLDLFYIKNMSPWLDLVIASKTVKTMLVNKGSS